MKLEVGMYIRTKEGYICKLLKLNEPFEDDGYLDHNDIGSASIQEKNVIKASHNIIDLIEEKDLLEIEYFSLRYEKRVTRLFEVSFKDGKYINLSNAKCEFMLINGEFNEQDKELMPIIKSIATKEQFESISYKVGE